MIRHTWRPTRILRVFALLTLAFSVTTSAEVTNPDTYTYLSSREPLTIDPVAVLEIEEHYVAGDVFQRLLKLNLDNPTEILGDAAESWEVSDDGLAYTFHLRSGLSFHDGSSLTAEDVKYSIDRFVLSLASTGVYLHLSGIVGAQEFFDSEHTAADVDTYLAAGGVEVVDEDTVVVRTYQREAPFLLNFTFWGYITSKAYVEAHGGITPGIDNAYLARNPMGSGAFKFVEWAPSQRIILERFDNYWEGPAQLKYVVMEIVTEPATQLLKLRSGEGDAIYRVDQTIIDEIYDTATGTTTSSDLVLSIEQALTVTGLMMNLSIEPYSELTFRKALTYAFPYEFCYEVIDSGILMLPFNGILPKGMPFHSEEFPNYAQDQDLAKALFQEAGWTGTLTIYIRTGRTEERDVSLLYKDAIEALDVGIQVDIIELAISTWKDMRREGELEIYFGGWATDTLDPHGMVEAYYRSVLGFHASHTRLNDVVLDVLIEGAVLETDPARRAQL